MNRLDHVVTDNLNNYKYQSNEAIKNEPTFDTINFNLSGGTIDPLPVVTVYLRGGNKHGAMTVSGLTCFWDIGATYSMIKRKHAEYYERKMRYNEVEYSISSGLYCATHDVKVIFCMP